MNGALGLQDWAWWVTGGLLLVAGAVLSVWALLWDRAKGGRRCPSCWYDLSGSPPGTAAGRATTTCPECGRRTHGEKALRSTRRRWRYAALASMLLLAGAASAARPTVKRQGVAQSVPTPILIALLPRAGTEWRLDPVTGQWGMDTYSVEMERRLNAGDVTDSQLRWALRRTGAFQCRERWPVDLDLRVGFWPPRWLPTAMITGKRSDDPGVTVVRRSGLSTCGTGDHYDRADEQYQPAGKVQLGAQTVIWNLSIEGDGAFAALRSRAGNRPFSGTVELSSEVTGVERAEDAVLAVNSPQCDAAARRALSVDVATWNANDGPTPDRYLMVLVDRSKAPEMEGIALGFEVDLVQDGIVRQTIRFPQITSNDATRQRGVEQVARFAPSVLKAADVARWSVRVRGSAEASLREFDCPRYWAGEFTVPLSEVLTR